MPAYLKISACKLVLNLWVKLPLLRTPLTYVLKAKLRFFDSTVKPITRLKRLLSVPSAIRIETTDSGLTNPYVAIDLAFYSNPIL